GNLRSVSPPGVALRGEPHGDLGARAYAQLAANVLEMGLRGPCRDKEPLRDVLVGQALRDEGRDLALAWTEPRRVFVRCALVQSREEVGGCRDHRLPVALPSQVGIAVKWEEGSARDQTGNFSAETEVRRSVPLAVHHKGRDLDGGQDARDIGAVILLEKVRRNIRRRRA